MNRREFILVTVSSIFGVVAGIILQDIIIPWAQEKVPHNDTIGLYSRNLSNGTLALMIANNSDQHVDISRLEISTYPNDTGLESFLKPSNILLLDTNGTSNVNKVRKNPDGSIVYSSTVVWTLAPDERDMMHIMFVDQSLSSIENLTISVNDISGKTYDLDGQF